MLDKGCKFRQLVGRVFILFSVLIHEAVRLVQFCAILADLLFELNRVFDDR